MILETVNSLAVRKHALPLLRTLKLKQPDDFAPHSLEWRELVAARKEIIRSAKKLLDGVTDELGPDDARSIERAHDGLVAMIDEADAEMNYRDEINDRSPREESRSASLRPIPADAEVSCGDGYEGVAIRSGWVDAKGSEVRVLAPSQKLATSRNSGPQLGSILRAMVTGARNDAERRALAEGTDSAGGYTVPTPLAREFIDKLRAKSVCMRAGARTVDMTSETLAIARLETDPTMAWRDENAAAGESDPTFGRVLLTARSLMGIVRVSRELLDDSVNVGDALENAFAQAAALEFDRACLYGSGVAPEPLGVALTSGINEVDMGANGAALAGWDNIADAIYEMQVDNAPDPTGMIYHPRTAKTFNKMKDGQGLPITMPPAVASIPRFVTTSIPINETQGSASNASSIILGAFPEMFVGLRSTLRIEVLRERYAEYHQYAFVAHMRGDVQLAHKASFCRIKGIIP